METVYVGPSLCHPVVNLAEAAYSNIFEFSLNPETAILSACKTKCEGHHSFAAAAHQNIHLYPQYPHWLKIRGLFEPNQLAAAELFAPQETLQFSDH